MTDDLIQIRKVTAIVDEIWHEGGPRAAEPLRMGGVCAVMQNPYAGRYVEDLLPMMDALKPVGVDMTKRLLDRMGVAPAAIEAYGKGAIVGSDGELEHGALWHVPGGYAMRDVLGGAKAIVPSAKKVGALGARIDIPLHHIDAAYVRSHFSAMELGVTDAPRPGEIVFMLAMATGSRVHARVGGLAASEITAGDGLR